MSEPKVKALIECEHWRCTRAIEVWSTLRARIGDGGSIEIEVTPIVVPAGWSHNQLYGLICDAHEELEP